MGMPSDPTAACPAAAPDDASGAPEFSCPTCGAGQTLSETCRRCGSDLGLVVELQRENRRLRRRCLAYLRQRRLLPATRLAQQCYRVSSDDRNLGLLATCYLMRGDFASAVTVLARTGALPSRHL